MFSPLKVGLLIVNVLCLFSAIGMIVIGASGWRSSFVEDVLKDTKDWCLTLGLIALLTCLLGSFVIIFASKLLEWLHFLAVIGLIIICMVHAILDIFEKKGVLENAHTHMKEAYDKRMYDSIDIFQRELQCCGYNSKFDAAVKKAYFDRELIDSCCEDDVDKCMIEMASKNNCSNRVEYISTLSSIIIVFAFLNALMLLILAVLLVLKFIHKHKVEIEQSARYYEDDEDDVETDYSTYSPSRYSQNTTRYSQSSRYSQGSKYVGPK